jgi:hypothetical protein
MMRMVCATLPSGSGKPFVAGQPLLAMATITWRAEDLVRTALGTTGPITTQPREALSPASDRGDAS